MYSHPPSRIDGCVIEPAHQSIPDRQMCTEADAMKIGPADFDGQQRFARRSRNPSRTCTGTHRSSRQLLPGQGPPASFSQASFRNKRGGRPERLSVSLAVPPAGLSGPRSAGLNCQCATPRLSRLADWIVTDAVSALRSPWPCALCGPPPVPRSRGYTYRAKSCSWGG